MYSKYAAASFGLHVWLQIPCSVKLQWGNIGVNLPMHISFSHPMHDLLYASLVLSQIIHTPIDILAIQFTEFL